jgi:hypothetical protein
MHAIHAIESSSLSDQWISTWTQLDTESPNLDARLATEDSIPKILPTSICMLLITTSDIAATVVAKHFETKML